MRGGCDGEVPRRGGTAARGEKPQEGLKRQSGPSGPDCEVGEFRRKAERPAFLLFWAEMRKNATDYGIIHLNILLDGNLRVGVEY